MDLTKIDLTEFSGTEQPLVPPQDPLRSTLSEAVKVNPDQQANLQRLSRQSGVPQFAVESNPDEVQTALNLKNINLDSLVKDSPKTAEFLQDWNNASVIHDDIDMMRFGENVITSLKNAVTVDVPSVEDIRQYGADIKTSFQTGQYQVESSQIGIQRAYAALGLRSPLDQQSMERQVELDKLMRQDPSKNYGFALGAPVVAAQQLPILADILGGGIQTGSQYVIPGATAGLTIGLARGRSPIPGVQQASAVSGTVAGAVTMGIQGSKLGLAKSSFELEGGLAMNEFSSMLDENGNGLEPEVAAYAAISVGAINAGLEYLSLAKLAETITPAMRGMVRSQVKQALQTETGREFVLRVGKAYIENVGMEATTEGLQEFTNVIGGELAKYFSDQSFTEQDFGVALENIFSEETLSRTGEAFYKGAQAAAVFGTLGTVVQVAQEVRARSNRGNNDQQIINDVSKFANQSKLKERDPEKFRQFVEQSDGDNNSSIYIDGAQVSLYLQTKTQEEIAADPGLQRLQEQASEAAALGGDVVVPVADFATDLAGTEHFEALRPHMTLSAESISPFRQEQVQAETQSYIEGLMNEAEQNVSEYVESQQIFETVRQQLVDSGAYNDQNAKIMAQVVPAWATVFAKKNGITVQEAYDTFGFKVEGPQTGRMAELTGGVPVTADQIENNLIQETQSFPAAVDEFTDEQSLIYGTVHAPVIDPSNPETFDNLQKAIELRRSDIAEVIVSRAEKQADSMQTTPGVAEDSPKYAEIAADLKRRKDQALANAKTLRDQLEANREIFEQPGVEPEPAPAFAPSREDVTPEFKAWFGDSKVVDENGEPLVVYHGTAKDIDSFKGMVWGSAAPDLANEYAFMRGSNAKRGDNLIPLYMSIERPFDADLGLSKTVTIDSFFDAVIEQSEDFGVVLTDVQMQRESELIKEIKSAANREESGPHYSRWDFWNSPSDYFGRDGAGAIKELFELLGFDGIKMIEDDQVTYGAFEPSQVKSSIGNRGTFDPNDPNILNQSAVNQPNLVVTHNLSAENILAVGLTNDRIAKLMREYGYNNGTVKGTIVNVNPQDFVNATHSKPSEIKAETGKLDIEKMRSETQTPYLEVSGGKIVGHEGRHRLQALANAGVTSVPIVLVNKDYSYTTKESGFKEGDVFSGQFDGTSDITITNPVDISYANRTAINESFGKGDILYQPGVEPEPAPAFAPSRGYYNPSEGLIRLTEAADLSTFLHEFAHFMYEMELTSGSETIQSINNWFRRNAESVAKEANDYAPNTTILASHVEAYLDNGTTGDKERDDGIRRALHEQFARSFETYLMEGKAPSIELRNAFRAFARWLTTIYKAIKGDLKVNLDDEMRQVFDRLLATEEQIAAAEARARYAPMFTDATMAGMTEQEWTDYQKRQEKVKDKQTETLRDKLIGEITRATKRWWKQEKSDVEDEVTAQLQKERVYVARDRLKTGDIKLDRATVKEMVGEEFTDKRGRKFNRVPPALNGMHEAGGAGIHPDEAAAVFGYGSGSEMIKDLMEAENIKDVAEARAEQIMLERHGDILNDGTIEQQADEAVQNEERGRFMLHELKILSRGTNVKALERQAIKDMAERRIGQLSYRQINPGKYRKAEIKAAQEAAKMLAEGNKEGAAAAKTRQVVNYYLGMAATEARTNTDKIVDRMGRYRKKNVREEIQKAGNEYWEQITRILERFEFRKGVSMKKVDQINTDINSWMKARIEEDGDALVLSNAVLNESYVTHWKNVAFADLQGIYDSVRNIEHVARYSNKITRLQEEMDFKELVQKWVTHINDKVETKFKSQRTDVIEGRKWGQWAMAQMTKIPYMARWLDGGETAGLSHQILMQPFTDAYDAEIKLWGDVGRPVLEMIEQRSKEDIKRHNRKIFIPEIKDENNDGNLYGHQILSIALNTGNQSNLRKLLLGEGWASPEFEDQISFDNPKLQAVLRHMTENDWKLVQSIWDNMETLYPMLAEVHRKTTGLTPPKVEPTPVQTPYGEFKGGYYPVKYDPNRSQRAMENEDKLNAQTESMFSNNASIQASVNAGATNERTGYYAPIRLSLDVVPAHFQETIHYITHHDAVREVNKLIRNPSVAKVITEKLGAEEYAQLRPWLNDIAKDGREAPTKMFWDSILQRLRFGVTLGAMGFKASTGLMQLLGLSNTVAEVGIGPVMQSARSILGSTTTMREAWDFASSNSKVLNHRAQTMDREIKNAMQRVEGKRGFMAAVQEASMKHIALIQTYMVDLPSWQAAYIKAMKEHGDEQRAYQYADWVVENIQGSGATKDMARIMRGQTETGRMFTMFMTFFSSLWNMERDLVRGARSGQYSYTSTAAKAMFIFVIPVFLEMLMRGEFGGDDDPEKELQTFLTKTALYPVQSVPFLRDIANATTGDYGYNITPMQQILEQGTRTIPELMIRPFTDEEITKGQVKGATKFIGAATGIPGTGQAWATGEHLYDVMADGEDLTIRELLFGPKKD